MCADEPWPGSEPEAKGLICKYTHFCNLCATHVHCCAAAGYMQDLGCYSGNCLVRLLTQEGWDVQQFDAGLAHRLDRRFPVSAPHDSRGFELTVVHDLSG